MREGEKRRGGANSANSLAGARNKRRERQLFDTMLSDHHTDARASNSAPPRTQALNPSNIAGIALENHTVGSARAHQLDQCRAVLPDGALRGHHKHCRRSCRPFHHFRLRVFGLSLEKFTCKEQQVSHLRERGN